MAGVIRGDDGVELQVKLIHTLAEAKAEITRLGCDPYGIERMSPKAVHRVVKLKSVRAAAANIIKQEMLANGGEAAVHRDTVTCRIPTTDVLLMGTLPQYAALTEKLTGQPFGLSELAEQLKTLLTQAAAPAREWVCGRFRLPIGKRTYIMGILNVTPDSFSDGGKYNSVADALQHAQRMVADGADIIDIGGESTRPGAQLVSVDEELSRVIPVVERLATELSVPISIDTSKAAVAAAACKAGAAIINDIWGLQADAAMADVVAETGAGIVIMHNQHEASYSNLMDEIIAMLQESINRGLAAGVSPAQIAIDPGFGFGKTPTHNLALMHDLAELQCLGYPVLLGTSRKSTIGKVLDRPVDQRVEGTAATVAVGITYGAEIVRVHDVKEITLVAKMTDAMVRGGK